MGKPGKKAGKGKLPPTNVNRKVDSTQTHLRDQRTIKRLKMYTSKIKRDEKGNILKGSVLSASDKVEKSMARIAPDRRWFGNTRTIGQEALQQFREEVGAKYRDPYSVVIKQSKLPLSLLEDPAVKGSRGAGGSAAGAGLSATTPGEVVQARKMMEWENTFGEKAQRKRVRLAATSVEELGAKAAQHTEQFIAKKLDPALVQARHGTDGDQFAVSTGPTDAFDLSEQRIDKTQNRKLFKKGQSNRIWNELYKVIDSADVILYVLDARDPLGTRSRFIEEYMKKEKKYKHFVFVLNKTDLIPLWATARWLQILSKDYPTVAFHASVEHPFGKGNLISLLRQFSRLHNVSHRGGKRTKTPISVGIIGYPNVGKSSIINTLRRKSVCKVACIPGETKVWQYVALTKSIFLIDCPGIVYDREGNNDVQAVLKGVVRVERLGSADKSDVVQTVVDIVKRDDLIATYGVDKWQTSQELCETVAIKRGKLLPGGVPDTDTIARVILYDWQRGKIPWFNAPPFESNEQHRKATGLQTKEQLKVIEHYNTFNVIDDRIHTGAMDDVDDDLAAAGAADEEGADAGTVGGRAVTAKQRKAKRSEVVKGETAAKGKLKKAEVESDEEEEDKESVESIDTDGDDEEEDADAESEDESEDDDEDIPATSKKHRPDPKAKKTSQQPQKQPQKQKQQQQNKNKKTTAAPATATAAPVAPNTAKINPLERDTINVNNTRSGLGETIATATLLREQQEQREKRQRARQKETAKRGGANAKTLGNTSLKEVEQMQKDEDLWDKFVGASKGKK